MNRESRDFSFLLPRNAWLALVLLAQASCGPASNQSRQQQPNTGEQAPPLAYEGRFWDETLSEIQLAPAGGQWHARGSDLWQASEYGEPSCEGAFLPFAWRVVGADVAPEVAIRVTRSTVDFPEEVLLEVSDTAGHGRVGYCQNLSFTNQGDTVVLVRVRFASAADFFVQTE